MAGVLVGMFICLVGLAIAANAAFADRLRLGVWIAIAGGIVTLGGIVDLLI